MKKFLAVYIGTQAAFEQYQRSFPDPQQRAVREKEGMAAWGEWVAKRGKSIVDTGAPLGRTKRIGKDGVSDIRNNLTAYTIVQAESHEAAARLFEQHPHFTIFPGDSIEVMECLPIPNA